VRAAAASATPASIGDADTTALVRQYAHVVKRIAAQIHRRSPPSVQRDDLIAAGMSGLWDAVRRRGADRDENFDFYVCTRVRGAIIDELRTEDWLPRRRLTADGSSRTSTGTAIVYFEDMGGRETRRSGEEELLDGEQAVETRMALERVMDALSRLPARERYVLLMRDVEGVPIKDLGEELGVSRPRICQLRTQALRRLREFLGHGVDAEATSADAADPEITDEFTGEERVTNLDSRELCDDLGSGAPAHEQVRAA
jgi:RNA polymerase sigma factor for flagellar operon FliA